MFTHRIATVYTIEKSRGHEAIVGILGRNFHGALVSDCFLAYDHEEFSDWLKQKCYAHFLKTLGAMDEEKIRGAVRFPRAVTRVLRDALQLGKERDRLTCLRRLPVRGTQTGVPWRGRQAWVAFQDRRVVIERELDKLIDERRRFTDPDNAQFARRLRKQRNHLFTFLTHNGVEPTNNRAERRIRPAVVIRKTGACNKTEAGARAHSVITSVLVTAKQRGVNGIRYLADVLTAPGQAPPIPFPAPASDDRQPAGLVSAGR